VIDTNANPAGSPAFEFHPWMSFLESREREALTLRFVEEWEYHEIAAAKGHPDRDGPVASVQRQEEARRTPESAPAFQKAGGLNTAKDGYRSIKGERCL